MSGKKPEAAVTIAVDVTLIQDQTELADRVLDEYRDIAHMVAQQAVDIEHLISLLPDHHEHVGRQVLKRSHAIHKLVSVSTVDIEVLDDSLHNPLKSIVKIPMSMAQSIVSALKRYINAED